MFRGGFCHSGRLRMKCTPDQKNSRDLSELDAGGFVPGGQQNFKMRRDEIETRDKTTRVPHKKNFNSNRLLISNRLIYGPTNYRFSKNV